MIMESVSENEKPTGLEKDLLIWLDILQLWRSHLTFLQIRLKGQNQRKVAPVPEGELTYFLQEISLFSESILADYQEALRKDLVLRKEHSQSLVGAKWVEEHDLFARHMQQLRSEYHKILEQIMTQLES